MCAILEVRELPHSCRLKDCSVVISDSAAVSDYAGNSSHHPNSGFESTGSDIRNPSEPVSARLIRAKASKSSHYNEPLHCCRNGSRARQPEMPAPPFLSASKRRVARHMPLCVGVGEAVRILHKQGSENALEDEVNQRGREGGFLLSHM